MVYDLQKANIWKRISAYLFDFILVCMLAVGFAALMSTITGYDTYQETIQEYHKKYEEEYNVDLNISQEDFNALTDAEKEYYNDVLKKLYADDDFFYAYYMSFNLSFVITLVGILLAFLTLEFVVPMFLKNGQTIGKKVFGVAVMRIDGVKISGPILFTRAILGKCIVETLLPVIFILMVVFNVTTLLSAAIAIAAIMLTNVVMMIASKNNAGIHDMISNTVAVDLASQLIFDTPEDLLEYKKKIHAEAAERAEYR